MNALPNPELRHVYRLDAELDAPVDLGHTPQGHRRIIPLTRADRIAGLLIAPTGVTVHPRPPDLCRLMRRRVAFYLRRLDECRAARLDCRSPREDDRRWTGPHLHTGGFSGQ